MKKILLILSLVVTAIAAILIAFNAEKIYTSSYTFIKEKILTTVPNYSKERGFDIVSQEEYEKYQQGYCLSENRILPFEEKYRKAIGQYLDKNLEYYKLFYAEWCWVFEKNCKQTYSNDFYIKNGIDVTPEAVTYYELNDNLTLSNWFEVLIKVCKEEKCDFSNKRYRNFFFNELNAVKTDPKQYLIINRDDMTAGFSRPIVMYQGYYYGIFYLFLDKSFILFEDSSTVFNNYIYI